MFSCSKRNCTARTSMRNPKTTWECGCGLRLIGEFCIICSFTIHIRRTRILRTAKVWIDLNSQHYPWSIQSFKYSHTTSCRQCWIFCCSRQTCCYYFFTNWILVILDCSLDCYFVEYSNAVGCQGQASKGWQSMAGHTNCLVAKEMIELERQLNLERKRRHQAETEQGRLHKSLKQVSSKDQVHVLEKGTMQGSSWSPESLQTALHLGVACRNKGYDIAKENVVFLSARRTLEKQTEHIKFSPGKW